MAPSSKKKSSSASFHQCVRKMVSYFCNYLSLFVTFVTLSLFATFCHLYLRSPSIYRSQLVETQTLSHSLSFLLPHSFADTRPWGFAAPTRRSGVETPPRWPRSRRRGWSERGSGSRRSEPRPDAKLRSRLARVAVRRPSALPSMLTSRSPRQLPLHLRRQSPYPWCHTPSTPICSKERTNG